MDLKTKIQNLLATAAVNAVQASMNGVVSGGLSTIAVTVDTVKAIPDAIKGAKSGIENMVNTQVSTQLETAIANLPPPENSGAQEGGSYRCSACSRRVRRRRGRKTRSRH